MPGWRMTKSRIAREYLEELTCFEKRSGEIVTWTELESYAENGARLIDQLNEILPPSRRVEQYARQ